MKFVLKNYFALYILIGMTACHLKTENQTENQKESGNLKGSRDLEMDGMQRAIRQQFIMTRDPILNIIPTERLLIAKQKARNSGTISARTTAVTWQERGPNNIGGRTRTIMVDKRDPTGNTIFAGSVSGGIFKTTNFLSATPSWAPVDDQLLNLAITSIVQDKNNLNTIYAGTGEGWFNIDAVKGAGIYKSTDGGITWNRLVSTTTFEFVQDLLVDNNSNVYAALRNEQTSNRGVLRSTDGGNSWVQVLGLNLPGFTTGRAADLELASNGDIYATLGIFSKTQVMKSSFSVNGANTGSLNSWVEITPVHSIPTQRGEIAVSPSNPQRLYLMMQDSATSQILTLYRSSDGGILWDSLPAPAALNNGAVSQCWYNLIAAVDPNNQNVLVVGGLRLAKSIDAGANFTDISSAGVHVDQHELVYLSSTGLIVGNDGGIIYTANANATSPTFINKNNGFNATQFYGVDFHPTLLNYFLAGAQDNNTQKFLSAGINTTTPVVGGDGGFPHIDQTDGQIQIAATTENNFYRSLDGGNLFSYLSAVSNSRGMFINASDYDDNLNTLYSTDAAGRYYYINNLGGTPSGNFNSLVQIGASRLVTAVKVDPFSSGTVYLGASYDLDATGSAVVPVVMKVTNANTAAPNVVSSSSLSVPAGSYISSIDVDPANGNHLLATLSNYGVAVRNVFESIDGGASWNSIEGNLPDMPVYSGFFAPANAQLNGAGGGNGGIMLATEVGIWTTSQINGAATQWITNNNGFPNVRTDMVKIRLSDYQVVAASHGRGLFTTTLPSTATGVNTVDNTRNFIKFTTVNSQQLFIKIGNLPISKMQVRIFDIKGRLVSSSDSKYSDQTIQIGSLPASSYILKIYGNKGEQYTRHFVK